MKEVNTSPVCTKSGTQAESYRIDYPKSWSEFSFDDDGKIEASFPAGVADLLTSVVRELASRIALPLRGLRALRARRNGSGSAFIVAGSDDPATGEGVVVRASSLPVSRLAGEDQLDEGTEGQHLAA